MSAPLTDELERPLQNLKALDESPEIMHGDHYSVKLRVWIHCIHSCTGVTFWNNIQETFVAHRNPWV